MRRLAASLAVFLVAAAACNDDPLPNKSQVKQVRILAVRADLPYAHPGETVNLEALVHDGREEPTLPMRMQWFDVPCINPPGGQYFDCYPFLEAAYPVGVDLTPMLKEGTFTSIAIPNDALDGVVPEPGRGTEPVVTSWSFMFACAGHVERKVRIASRAENQAPFGCFGPDGRELPAEEGVFGFTRVTVTATRRNNPPTITALTHRIRAVDVGAGVRVEHCDRGFLGDLLDEDCDVQGMDIRFDESDAEIDPDNVDAEGRVGKETLYVDWYVTLGRFLTPRVILRDPVAGAPEQTNVLYEATREPGKGTLWAVLHDNRGGVSWVSTAIEVY